MPLYEWDCPTHGRFELLMELSASEKPATKCPQCGKKSERIYSLAAVFPDNLWAGHQIEGRGYFTSKSKLDKTMKEQHHVPVGDRADAEGMRKMANEAAKARDEKFAQESREFMRGEMAKRGLLDSDGNLRPEASKPITDTPLIHTNDPRVKP